MHWGLPLCRPHHYASLTVQCTGTMPKLDIVPVDVFSSPFECNVCCLGTLYAHMRQTVTHTCTCIQYGPNVLLSVYCVKVL